MHARTHACLRTRMHHGTCPCLPVSPPCVHDICHRKPHNGPSHHGSPIVHLCHIYAHSSSRVPRVHPASCVDETDAPIHPASSVDTFDTKAFLSHSSLVTGSVGYQEINRCFVRILDITSLNETERTAPRFAFCIVLHLRLGFQYCIMYFVCISFKAFFV